MLRALELIGGFTADQWGMITARQATNAGLDRPTLRRLCKAGHLDHVRHGVYASTGAAITPARDQQAAWLALNPAVAAWERPPLDPDGGVLSHQSAINLHGLGELFNDRITFTTPRRRTSRDPDLWFKIAKLAEHDVTHVDNLPVTTVLRTICDLLDQHIDGGHIATIIREGVIANMVGLDELADRIGPYALRYGVRQPDNGLALLDHLLAQIGTTTADLVNRPAPEQARERAAFATLLPASEITRIVGAGATGNLAAVLKTVAEVRDQYQVTDGLRAALAALSAPALRTAADAVVPHGLADAMQAVLASTSARDAYTPALEAIAKTMADIGRLSALYEVSDAVRTASAQALAAASGADAAAETAALAAGISTAHTADRRTDATGEDDDHDRTEAPDIPGGLQQLGAQPGQERGQADGDVLR
jgi:predicted transcriptional regulator of viral defense system